MEVIEDPALRPRNPMPPGKKEEMRTATNLFLTPAQRRSVIRRAGKAHGLNVLIETGTNRGDTPWALRGVFDRIYTIELDRHLWREAQRRFAREENVVCLRGDSVEVLPKVLDELEGPALVWLDGHYSGPGTALGSESTPIRGELGILFNDRFKHVILVDDARCFYGGAENPYDGEPLWDHYGTYPSLNWVQEQAEANGYTYTLKDDIIRLAPNA